MGVKRYSVWDDEMFEEKHALNSTNGMVHLVVKHEDYAALEQQLAAVVAENAGLKVAHPQPFGPEMMKALDAYEKHQDEVPETGMLDAYFILRDSIRVETPATDAYLAEVRAQGVEMYAEHLTRKAIASGENKNHAYAYLAANFAAQLRQGAEK